MKKTNYRWIIRIVVITLIISMTFTFASAEILGSAGYVMAFVVLAVFIALGILFDIIGVAVTASGLLVPAKSVTAICDLD